MNPKMIAVILAAVALGGWTWAGGEDTNRAPPALRLELELVDGSRVIGVPAIESVPVQTPYAKMDIPLNQITSVRMDADHETASVALLNGDKLKGVISLKPLELTTVFGPVKIGVEHLRNLTVVSPVEGFPSILARGLVLHYTFDKDEGGVVTDKSGKGNDGKLQGAVRRPNDSTGGVCSFNGRDARVNCGRGESLNITRNLTVSLWFKKSEKTWGEPHQLQAIIGKDDGDDRTGRTFILYRFDSPGNSLALSYGVRTGVQGRHHVTAGNLSLADEQWHHILAVHETDVGNRLYVDGTCVARDREGSSLPSTPNTDLIIGKTQAWEPWFFYGTMDEVMIFDRGISDDEVKILHNAQKPLVSRQ